MSKYTSYQKVDFKLIKYILNYYTLEFPFYQHQVESGKTRPRLDSCTHE